MMSLRGGIALEVGKHVLLLAFRLVSAFGAPVKRVGRLQNRLI
jgi:hypothetical protein